MSVSSWEPDPTGRHQYRWFDGEEWTDQVSDDGIQKEDRLASTERFAPPYRASGMPPPPPPTDATGDPADAGDGKTVIVAGHRRSLASPMRRLGARLIDSVILFIPTFIVAFIVIAIAIDSDSDGAGVGYVLAITALGALFGILYEVTLVATRGQTLGKMATGIVIVRSDSGLLPGWGKATGRWALPTVLGFIPVIGGLIAFVCYLSLTWGRNHQGWHDKVAGTYVVMS